MLVCFNLLGLRTIIHPIPRLLYPSLTTSHKKDNPYRDATKLFISYCTGDVFTGTHNKWYFPLTLVRHQGYANTEKTLAHLNSKNILNFASFDEVYVGGSSAGAIGAVVHAKNVENYLSEDSLKILMIDSPGLHFGKTFWDKFSDNQVDDFVSAFGKIHLYPSINDGFVAPYMAPVFEYLNRWKIGIIQATRDVVMSTAFGDITQDEHETLVLGPQGIGAVASPYPHVKVWTAPSVEHAFLIFDSKSKGPEQETAIEFMNSLIRSARKSHR
jgi:hypothetical protein